MESPFSSCGQPAPAALLAELVPPGTVFRQEGTDIEFTIKKVRKWGKYDTPLPMTKHWLQIVNKIHVDNGVPVVDWRGGNLPFYAGARTMDEESEHRRIMQIQTAEAARTEHLRKMQQQTVEAARKHLVGRYFWERLPLPSYRVAKVAMYAGRPMAWLVDRGVPSAEVIFLYPSSVPKLVTFGLSLAEHTRLTGERDGVATWIRDYTRENAIAICMKRLQLPPEITQLILQYFWSV
jgi:hypothetical protein